MNNKEDFLKIFKYKLCIVDLSLSTKAESILNKYMQENLLLVIISINIYLYVYTYIQRDRGSTKKPLLFLIISCKNFTTQQNYMLCHYLQHLFLSDLHIEKGHYVLFLPKIIVTNLFVHLMLYIYIQSFTNI